MTGIHCRPFVVSDAAVSSFPLSSPRRTSVASGVVSIDTRHRAKAACLLAGVVVGLTTSSVCAQQNESVIDPTRRGGLPDDYGATASASHEDLSGQRSVQTLTEAEARRQSAASMGDVLDGAEGLSVQRTSGPSAVPIIRGLTGYRVLLQYGDVRLNDALTRVGGSALLNLIDPLSFSQMQVERGPSSVLHGSDAIAGAVLLVPLEPLLLDEPSVGGEAFLREASAERGVTAGGKVEVRGPKLAAQVSGFYDRHGNQVVGGRDGKQPYSKYWGYGATATLKWVPAKDHALFALYQLGAIRDAPRTDLSRPDDLRTTSLLSRDIGSLRYAADLPNAQLSVLAAVVNRTEIRERIKPASQESERDHVLSYQSRVRLSLTPWSNACVDAGLDMSFDDVDSSGKLAPASEEQPLRGRYVDGSHYSLFGGYLQLTQGFTAKWTLQAGLRLGGVRAVAPEDPVVAELGGQPRLDDMKLATAAGLGLRRTIRGRWSWVFNLLQGFHAPNLEDYQALGGGAAAYTFPTTQLSPERAWTAETGFKGTSGGWTATAYAYGTLLTDMLGRAPAEIGGQTEIDGRPVKARANADRGVLVGGEGSLSYRWDIGVEAGVASWGTWGISTVEESDGRDYEPATKVPPPQGRAWLGYTRSNLWLRALLRYQAAQTRLSETDKDDVRICGEEACERVPGWAVVDVYGELVITPNWRLGLGVENLGNLLYRPFASGVLGPGTNVVMMLSARL